MGIMSIRKVAHKILTPVIVLLVVGLTVGLFYIGLPNMGKESFAYKGPSIKVNGQKVKDSEFNNYMIRASEQANQYAQYGMTFTEAQIRDTAVSMAVRSVSFEQEMKKVSSKIKVSRAEVDKLIKKYLPTEAELQNFMQRQGFANKNVLYNTLTKDLQQQKFIQNKARELKVKVAKSEVLEALEEIKVSHILISVKNPADYTQVRSDAEALKLAKEVYQKLKAGGNFAELAKQYSEDTGSKNSGGAIGPMPLNEFKSSMVKEFVDGSLNLKVGEISQPVKSTYGYHVIKLDSRTLPKGKEYNQKYTEAENNLLLQKADSDPAFTKWLEGVYQKAEKSLEIIDPALKAYRLKSDKKWKEAAEEYEKAIKRPYYKKKWDVYVDASSVYIELKQAKKAIEILTKAPAEAKEVADYQMALALAYKADGQADKAKDGLQKYGDAHLDDSSLHNKLKELFTEWKMTDAVAKEEKILADIEKKEKEAAEKYQQNLDQKQEATKTPAN